MSTIGVVRIPARSRETPVPRFPTSISLERNLPTLWPLQQNEWNPMQSAVDACEQENLALKHLVVRLSEIILNPVINDK
jgi:hypothetical protein